jgi:ABC-type arginine transport system ATPase subunit
VVALASHKFLGKRIKDLYQESIMSISINHISKHFGAFAALDNISLDIPEGEWSHYWGLRAAVKPHCCALLPVLNRPITAMSF